VIRSVAAVVVLVAAGLLPGWRLARRPIEAVVVSPLVGGLVLVPAGLLAVTTATSPVPWIVPTVAAAGLWSWRAAGDGPAWRPAGGRLLVVATVAALSTVALAHLSRPAVDLDAHSIWLYHSSWFAVGGEVARDAFRLEDFSHAEYPPLLPAPAGIVSRLVRGELEWRVAQTVIAAIGWSALATAGTVLVDGARRRVVTALGVIALAGVAVAGLGFGVANAEADFAAAATVALAAIALLVREEPGLVPLGLVAATAAALCKGESLVAVLVVVGLAWLRRGRPVQLRWAAPVVAGVGWVVLARLLGAESYLLRDGGFSIERVLERSVDSLGRLAVEMSPLAVAAAVASIGCAVLAAGSRRQLASLWVVIVAEVVGLALVYAVGDLELEGWLASSAPRVATGPELLAAVAAVLAADRCADAALTPDPGDRPRSMVPEPAGSPPPGGRSPAGGAPRSRPR
jgi:hypothetical protein